MGNILTRLAQLPEHGLFPYNPGIAFSVGGGGGDLHKLEDIVPGIVVIGAQFLQLVQHRHRVDGLGEVKHGVDGFIDFPVLPEIEIFRLYDAHHIRKAPAVDEDGTEYRLLRLQ